MCDGADFDPEDLELGVGRSESADSDAGAGAGADLLGAKGTDGGREHYLAVGYGFPVLFFFFFGGFVVAVLLGV